MDEARGEGSTLRAQVRVVLDEYRRKSAAWMEDAKRRAAGPAEQKEFQARHAALKAALGHVELLVRLARLVEGDGEAAESEADWEAEAERNLARPA